ncbi:hypothetical protein CesoFtcFv8_013849 [Champsocephalus esox]|uniref:Uncharacterized protein n=1 Tax=Champsocephalus esox TaxID=159716 RepID=A0AAN8BRZ4_9TELE|nr:hypothetical protein CesoFtcFv8_013849 [Champsocephalus esox]
MLKRPCAGRRAAAELMDVLMRRDPAEVLLPHGHPSLETSGRIIFIVLVDAELSRQQSYHSHVDLSSAPLTSEYVLALKRHTIKRFIVEAI